MIENRFTVDKDTGGCIQVSIAPLDDIPDMVRFHVREACHCGQELEEYEVDCALKLDEMEYLAERLLDAVAYQRKQASKPASEIPIEAPLEEALMSNEMREYYKLKYLLQKHHGDRKAVAREFGVSDRTLYRKLKQHNIE